MGFLRFLSKKQDKKVEDELDIPPPPPSNMGLGIDSDLNAPFPGDELSSGLSFPKEGAKPQTDKDLPSMDDFDFDIPASISEPARAMPTMEMPRPMPPQTRPISSPQMPSMAPSSGAPETQGKALYIEVDQFRKMMQDLSDIRSDLRKTEQVMGHMISTEVNRDKDYARYRGLLNDTQRKLVFIDKTLFKGGAA